MKACKIFLLVFLAFITVDATAQRLVFLFGHAGYASPTGDLKEANHWGLGVEAGAGVGLRKTFITGTVGFTWLAANKKGTTLGGVRYTPVLLGVRKYILTRNLFVKADAGVAGMKLIDTDVKSTKFTTSFGAGLKFTTFEALVDYTTVYRGYGSWFGLKVGMALGL
jgi:hypothetical protein